MRPNEPLASETATDERGDDVHFFLRHAEYLGDRVARAYYPLRSLVEREIVAFPFGLRRGRFHGIVVFYRSPVLGLMFHSSGVHGSVSVSAVHFQFFAEHLVRIE